MPREEDLGLLRIANDVGVGVPVLPSGPVFAIEHRSDTGAILAGQVLASPIGGGIARIIRYALVIRRFFGDRMNEPGLPGALGEPTLIWE